MKTIHYIPRGVCSREMEIDVDNDVIKAVRVVGGCNGNLQGISRRPSPAWRASTVAPSPPPAPTSWPRR